MAIRYNTPANEATKATHLICWRTSPLERRKRNTMLTAEANIHRGSSGRMMYDAYTSQGSASSPNGLGTIPWFSKGPGASPSVTLSSTITTPEKRARGRHLLDGSFPSGNSKTR